MGEISAYHDRNRLNGTGESVRFLRCLPAARALGRKPAHDPDSSFWLFRHLSNEVLPRSREPWQRLSPPPARNTGRSAYLPGDGSPLVAFGLQINNSVRRH